MEKLIAQIEADGRCEATHDTFGHLAPTKGVHKGKILFTYSDYGDIVMISDHFPTLQNSPWQFACMNDLLFELCCKRGDEDLEKGKVYLFEGSLTWGIEKGSNRWGDALTLTDWKGTTEIISELNHD